MTAVAESEVAGAASKEGRHHAHVRRVCLVHSSKLLEISERNPRFTGRVRRRCSGSWLSFTERNTWKTWNRPSLLVPDLHKL